MTTVRQYVASLRTVARTVGRAIGVDVAILLPEERAKLNLITGMNCVLIKLLVDKGLISDADVQSAYLAFMQDPNSYPDVPPPPPFGG